MLERPWPIVEPMATEPAVAAIWAIIPGPLDGAAWLVAAAGGGGAWVGAYPEGAAAVAAPRDGAGAGAEGREATEGRLRDWR